MPSKVFNGKLHNSVFPFRRGFSVHHQPLINASSLSWSTVPLRVGPTSLSLNKRDCIDYPVKGVTEAQKLTKDVFLGFSGLLKVAIQHPDNPLWCGGIIPITCCGAFWDWNPVCTLKTQPIQIKEDVSLWGFHWVNHGWVVGYIYDKFLSRPRPKVLFSVFSPCLWTIKFEQSLKEIIYHSHIFIHLGKILS